MSESILHSRAVALEMTSAQEAAVALLPRTRLLVLLARLLIFSLAEVSASLESGALLRCIT